MKRLNRKFRVPRIWSNRELEKFSHLLSGKVVNVSGWKDLDKEGRRYRDYFKNASEYWITNYKREIKGFQGDLENEVFLDLSGSLEDRLCGNYDVVFNHTVLEHVFEFETAFSNLCKMTRDIVIIVVPFLQEQHGAYGDYWRFSPQAIDRLFKKNGLKTIYINFNDQKSSSIYIFAIGSKKPEKWAVIENHRDNAVGLIDRKNIGTKIIRLTLPECIWVVLKRIVGQRREN